MAAVLSLKDFEMESSKVKGGEKEDRICHSMWNPDLGESTAARARVTWKADARHGRDDYYNAR